jgi:hypothetical protein
VGTEISKQAGWGLPIISSMLLASGCCGGSFAALSRAAAKSAAARLRQLGMLREHPDWARRAATCETCPLRVVRQGTSYCGRPFLQQIERDPATDGCGCPTHAKAKSPDEHCPLDWRNHAAQRGADGCTCKWCNDPAA